MVDEPESVQQLRAELNLDQCKIRPFTHQVIGIKKLLENPFFALFDEMGAGKTLQVIVAACLMFQRGMIKKVIVVCPNSVVPVWFDEDLGEIVKHLFDSLTASVTLYHGKSWRWTKGENPQSHWLVTNYEFLRSDKWLEPLVDLADSGTLLVLDETAAIKAWKAQQTQACYEVRKKCGRVILLNGTPIANNPMDLFAQGNMMHPSVLDCKFITKFRARYAEMGGYVVDTRWGKQATQVVGWKNLDDLQRRFAPYVLRRLKKDCLDLPPVLPPIIKTATLTKETWDIYREMRDDMVAWLDKLGSVSVAQQHIVKILRLSQITSGFIGGLEQDVLDTDAGLRPNWIPFDDLPPPPPMIKLEGPLQIIGREKLDVLLEHFDQCFEEEPNAKLVFWSRFIPELKRSLEAIHEKYPSIPLGAVAGQPMLGMKVYDERINAMRLLDPRTAPEGPAIVGGTYGTGSLGLNFTASHNMINVSYDYSHFKFVQSAARVDRPGQVHPVTMTDVEARGPKGQKTIDHTIIMARQGKAELAEYTASAWVKTLMEE